MSYRMIRFCSRKSAHRRVQSCSPAAAHATTAPHEPPRLYQGCTSGDNVEKCSGVMMGAFSDRADQALSADFDRDGFRGILEEVQRLHGLPAALNSNVSSVLLSPNQEADRSSSDLLQRNRFCLQVLTLPADHHFTSLFWLLTFTVVPLHQ
ncbi:hypothetical protein FQA47_021818 [Oryzias melastigma]|uniref:Uncharacterized protein n=1 Tax=Oryzias melastigma TaxID=30732 RepID=A0A834FR45_ORYME|nr:hypothetical protein FQA47_021818 [Oryzias melastigma]